MGMASTILSCQVYRLWPCEKIIQTERAFKKEELTEKFMIQLCKVNHLHTFKDTNFKSDHFL